MKKTLTTIIIISLLTFFLGCSEPLTTTEKGAGIGTVTGAGLGAIIGSATGHAGAGAGIGAAIGLIGGALIGDQIEEHQKQEQQIQQQMATQQAEIDRAEQELQQLKQQQEARYIAISVCDNYKGNATSTGDPPQRRPLRVNLLLNRWDLLKEFTSM